MSEPRLVDALRASWWRWLRDFAARRLEARAPDAKAQRALDARLLRAVSRVFGGRVVMVPADAIGVAAAAAAEAVAEATRQALLINAMGVAVYVTDADGRITMFNEAAAAMWGQRPVIGETMWCGSWRLFTDDGLPMSFDDCPLARSLKERRPIRGVEAVAERPDGTRVPFIPYPTPLLDADGALVGAVNVLVDISERKDAERHRAMLAREVDHRAKNLLAVVKSLVGLTKAGDLEGFRASLDGRIAALANAHSLLAGEHWDGAELADVAERELATYPGQVSLWGPAVRLAPAAVQPVSMLLHELATNAAKHGALSVATGRVSVVWEIEDAGRLKILWRETGGPVVEPPANGGFGSRLIRSLARQVRGEVSKDWRPEGLRCTILLPADVVREPPGFGEQRAVA